MNKIKTFEDACKALNTSETLPDVSALPEKHQKALLSHYKLIIITQALNEGWEPNWNNKNEWKYFPWFEVDASNEKPSGFGVSDSAYAGWSTLTYCGSRLCFKSSDLCLYAVEQFKQLYIDYYLM
ncbi:MAG: hypothetical protein A3F72_03075 [Bacteroidetes bacterium RIFCSPLOWO2_12_FULL_35_15]|nr:MAG: hypothetical protein A3F72_03075 [Bacteroidetes bacterium RIFCSPLOWO2_12_FULL_35_15]